MKYVLAKKIFNGVPVALIKWDRKGGTEYVVAYNCPFEDIVGENYGDLVIEHFNGSWGQGHYFMTLAEAYRFYIENYA